jgi:hypothetical protein
MKKLAGILIILGLVFVITAIIGRYVGSPYNVLGFMPFEFVIFASALFLLAILIKLFEKK